MTATQEKSWQHILGLIGQKLFDEAYQQAVILNRELLQTGGHIPDEYETTLTALATRVKKESTFVAIKKHLSQAQAP